MVRFALTALGLGLLALAAAVWRISEAHGHGVARTDRTTIALGIILGLLALLTAALRSGANRRDGV